MMARNSFSFPNETGKSRSSEEPFLSAADEPPTRRDTQTDLAVRTRPETKKPSLYKVFLINDDFTPMEFVVDVLETFFNKTREEATRIMMHVHQKGAGLCGVYTFEVAETKVGQVLAAARQAEHPLQCTMERE